MQNPLKEKSGKLLTTLIALALFTPLAFIPSIWMPNQSATFVLFCIAIELALPIYLYYLLKRPHERPSLKSPLLIVLLTYLGLYFISSFLGIDFQNSFWGNSIRNTGLFLQLHFLFFALYLSLLLTWHKSKGYTQLLSLLSIVGCLAAGYGILEYFGVLPTYDANFLPRASSVFGNPTLFGSFLTIPFFFALLASFKAKATRSVWLYRFMALSIFGGVIVSQSRGALLGILVGLLVSLIVRVLKEKNKGLKRKFLIVGLFSIIITCGVFTLTYINSPQGSVGYRTTHLVTSSSHERLLLWQMSIDGWKERPFFGTGYENFYLIGERQFNPDLYNFSQIWPDKPHNQPLEVLVTGGLFTAIAYLLFLLLIGKAFWFAERKDSFTSTDSSLLLATLVASVTQSLFLFETVAVGVTFFPLVAIALFLNAGKENSNRPHWTVPKRLETTAPTGALIGAVLMIIFIFKPLLVDLSLVHKAFASTSTNWEQTIDYIEQVGHNGFEYDTNIAADSARELTAMAFQDPNIDPKELFRLGETVLGHAQDNITEHPLRGAYLYHYLGTKITTSRYFGTEIDLDLYRHQMDTLTALAPHRTEYLPLQLHLGIEYFSHGLYEEGVSYLTWLSETSDVHTLAEYLDAAITYFTQINDSQTIVGIIELMITSSPNDPRLYHTLASAYQDLGETDKAEEALTKATELEEKIKQQFEEILQNIN